MKKKLSSTKGGAKKTKKVMQVKRAKAKKAKKGTKPLVIDRAKIKDLRVSEAEGGRRDAATVANSTGIAVVEPHRGDANARLAVVEPHVSRPNARLAVVEPHRPPPRA